MLYTGRSVRAAINELFDFGRPAAIELAVLIDRGRARAADRGDWSGARLAVARDESIVLSRDAGGHLALSTEQAPEPGHA